MFNRVSYPIYSRDVRDDLYGAARGKEKTVFNAFLKPELVYAKLRVEHWSMHLTKRNGASPVNFDAVIPGEAEALKDTPIIVISPCNAIPESLLKPASLPCFIFI